MCVCVCYVEKDAPELGDTTCRVFPALFWECAIALMFTCSLPQSEEETEEEEGASSASFLSDEEEEEEEKEKAGVAKEKEEGGSELSDKKLAVANAEEESSEEDTDDSSEDEDEEEAEDDDEQMEEAEEDEGRVVMGFLCFVLLVSLRFVCSAGLFCCLNELLRTLKTSKHRAVLYYFLVSLPLHSHGREGCQGRFVVVRGLFVYMQRFSSSSSSSAFLHRTYMHCILSKR